MFRRTFLKSIPALFGVGAISATAITIPKESKFLQTSSVAGFQYYRGDELWSKFAVGQQLDLIRETDNRYDSRAVRIEWQGLKIGYIPRMDNAAISQLLDRGEQLSAKIYSLKPSFDPWDRITVAVYVTV